MQRSAVIYNSDGTQPALSNQQWTDYLRDGFLELGPILSSEEVTLLCERADELALGKAHNPKVKMQLDTGGSFEDIPEVMSNFSSPTLLYRKVEGLEFDPLFSELLKRPLFAEICANHYGPHSPVSLFQAQVMNKPAGQGTYLPWHQDGGDIWRLDRDPLVTIWIALDLATRANGCVEVLPGSHRLGLLSQFGGNLSEENIARYCTPNEVLPLEVKSGHGLLINNWLIHRSGVNPSKMPRRAFTACYMDGRTLGSLTGNSYPLVFGEDGPHLDSIYINYLRNEHQALAQKVQIAEEYAKSLEVENEKLRQMFKEVERYAKSLEAARNS